VRQPGTRCRASSTGGAVHTRSTQPHERLAAPRPGRATSTARPSASCGWSWTLTAVGSRIHLASGKPRKVARVRKRLLLRNAILRSRIAWSPIALGSRDSCSSGQLLLFPCCPLCANRRVSGPVLHETLGTESNPSTRKTGRFVHPARSSLKRILALPSHWCNLHDTVDGRTVLDCDGP